MPHVIISGGPGAGKTTLIAELAAMCYSTVSESARAIISERLAQGKSPRPEPLSFAQEILQLVSWYGSCGYVIHEVPRVPAPERARQVVRVLERVA